jgi:large subunit ribosomal protein L24
MALKIRRDDTVRIITGKDRGKTGRVLRVDPEKHKVFVEGANIVKRHIKPRTLRDTQRAQEMGGIVEMEGPIHISNVMLIDPDSGEPTRVGIKREDNGKRVRVAKKSGKEIDGWKPPHRQPCRRASRSATRRRSSRASRSASATRP